MRRGGRLLSAPVRRTKAAQRDATTRRLITTARSLFAERGYAETPTESIVRQAGVTRGALYHHFGSKDGLFNAVLDDVQRDIARRVADAAQSQPDPWDQLTAGCHAFLAAALDPEVQRIMLIDAPAILGWEEWRRSDAANAMRLLHDSLLELHGLGQLAVASPESAAHLLSGAMNEAALWIAQSDDIGGALAAALDALDLMLGGLRNDVAART